MQDNNETRKRCWNLFIDTHFKDVQLVIYKNEKILQIAKIENCDRTSKNVLPLFKKTFQENNGITTNSDGIQLLKEASIQAKQKNIFFNNALHEKFKAKFDSANSKLEKDNNKMTEQAKVLTDSNNVEEMIDKALNEIQKDTDEGVNWDIIDDEQLTSLSEEEAALLNCKKEFDKFNTQYFKNIALQKIIKDNTQNEK